MAKQLAPQLETENPVVLAVMDGGAYTAIELCRRFDFPHEFDYVHATRYGRATRGGRLRWRVRPKAGLAGRTVLLVDDILDRGETLRALLRELRRVGVARALTAVLVVKRVAGVERPSVDVSGLTVDDKFIFGSGMDLYGYWRALPGIYVLDGSDHE